MQLLLLCLVGSATAFNIGAGPTSSRLSSTATTRSRAFTMSDTEPERDGPWLVWRRRFGTIWRRTEEPRVPEETVKKVKDLMAAPRSITVPKKSTGTSYLPAETVARAEQGSKFEKIKLGKDTTAMFTDLYEYAAKIRAGEMTWQDVEDADINTRLKWTGAPLKLTQSLSLTLTLTRTPTLT